MNQEQIGRFIAQCRKEHHMTQAQLAEKLGVTNKSVSKWETGKCLPDVSLFSEICLLLDITINEFFAGERTQAEKSPDADIQYPQVEQSTVGKVRENRKTSLLSTKNLHKEYISGAGSCVAVNHLNLDIWAGDFISIVGPSGSGKSSLIYLLSSISAPTSGEIFYKGVSLSEMTEKQKADYRGKEIGFVFQEENLLDDLVVLKNVALPGYLYDKRKAVDKKAAEWLNAIGMSTQKKKYPNELSGGQKQRAAIARALINQPNIIFLDEPTGSLDGAAGENILKLLVLLNEKGQSIVMVTHDMEAAARGSKVLFIKDGCVKKSMDLGKYVPEKLEERKKLIYRTIEEGARENS